MPPILALVYATTILGSIEFAALVNASNLISVLLSLLATSIELGALDLSDQVL